MGRILGVDYGTHRIGIASSDPMQMFASALEVIPATPVAACLSRLEELCRRQEVERVVVGLPLNMNGTKGPAAEAAEAFAEKLRGVVAVPVVLWDERLTTKSAHDALIEAGTRREKRKDVVDKVAAQILLQHYLDAQCPT
ncbi:MAG TPA: Holliday junction resolvase RuvX [Kiritimatiellia bacterium]|nr:Holliday junction resolvase RuvX [Kiritimatiellia bacterium]